MEAAAGGAREQVGATGLRRVITFWDSVALVVGLIIGSGIFRAPASVAQHLPTALLMMSAWVIGGALSLAGGLAAAELGVRFPRSGGQYVFLREAFGPAAAFAFGWTTVLISKPSILAGIATVFSVYASGLCGLPAGARKPLAAAAIVLLTAVNCLGVKSGTRTQNLLTAAKTLGLALLGAGVLLAGRGDWRHFAGGPVADGLAGSWGGLLPAGNDGHSLPVALALGLIAILYTYDGWIDVTYAAGEVIRPERVLPRAILLGTCACMGLYLLANVAYISVLAPAEMRGLENVAAIALERAFGPAGGTLLGLLVVVSTLGILNGSILTGVRVPYAMGRSGMIFAALGRVHPRTLSPVNALLAQGMFSCLVVLFAAGFDEIASLFVDTTWLFYALSFAGLLVIQRRERVARRLRGGGGRPGAPRMPTSSAASVARGTESPSNSRRPEARSELSADESGTRESPAYAHAVHARKPGAEDTGAAGAPAGNRSPRIPFSAPAAILFIIVTVFIIASDLIFSGPRVLVGMGVVVLAIPSYALWRAFAGGRAREGHTPED